MKSAGQIIAALAFGLLLSASARAGDVAVSANPYTPIVTRNIFGLVPIPTNPPVEAGPPATPPPKITPNGIILLFGKLEVLFKVAVPAKPGQPAKENAYVMSEGERQDDIEVTKIDQEAAVITFNNHGTVQELPLAAAPNLTTPVAPVPGVANPGGIPTPGSTVVGGAAGFAGRGGRGRGAAGTAAPNPPAAGTPNPASLPTAGGEASSQIYNPAAVPAHEQLSPEARVILMEKNRADLKAAGSSTANLIPPTVLTPQNTDEPAAPLPRQ